jgi:uncharacterized protein YrzB (UPF0473 family)
MTENGEERSDLVTLVDEEGIEHEFAVIDIFPVNLKQYAILVPVSYGEEGEAEDDDEIDLAEDAYIFRVDVNEEGGEETLVEVEDEAEWNEVAAEWESRVHALEEEDEGELF